MTNYDIGALSVAWSSQVSMYNQWKNITGKDMDYLSFSTLVQNKGVKTLFQGFENALEGNDLRGDGKDGNLLSFDRYFSEGNKIYVQTQDGKYISMDANSGELNSDSTAVMTELQNRFQLFDSGNNKPYNVADFSQNGVQFHQYGFVGSSDVAMSNNHFDHNELDLATDGVELNSIVQAYLKDHGGQGSLSDIFGSQNTRTRTSAGAVVPNGDVYQSVSANLKFVKQGDKLYAMTLKDGKFTSEEVTAANANKYYTGITSNPAPSDFDFNVNNNGEIEATVTYSNPNGTHSTDPVNPNGNGWGDPHFQLNGQQLFDLQGAGGGSTGDYTLLKNDNVTWTSHFDKYQGGKDGSTIMGSQHLELKVESGIIAIDYNQNGTYTIKHNGEVITDPSAYGVNVKKTGNAVNITQGNSYYNFNGYNVDTNAVKAGSTGVLTQLDDLTDGQASAANLNQRMVNSSCSAVSAPVKITNGQNVNDLAAGFISTLASVGGPAYASTVMTGASPNLTNRTDVNYSYNPLNDNTRTLSQKAELCARIAYAAIQDSSLDSNVKKACVANWIEMSSQSMTADIDAAKGSKTSFASRFQEGHGYSRSQWNEYMGTVSFGSKVDIDKNGTEDIALDIDGDGAIDGYDLNGDKTLSANERVIKELDEALSTRTVSLNLIS